ncbi:hypothetical protein BGZ65_003370, partial [Modicella reniformis]
MGVDLEEGLYNIRFVLNLENLNIDEIESISFSQRHGIHFGGVEPIHTFLIEAASSSPGTLVLGLHRQFCIERKSEVQAFNMEIRTSNNPSPTNDPGCVVLRYMEFREFQIPIVDYGVVQLHQPFLSSIDVNYEDDPTTVSTKIICYAVSGDGNVATLWDLEMGLPHIVNTEDVEGKASDTDTHFERRAAFRPKPCA